MAKEKENLEKEDVRKIILDLAEEGKTSEKIGLILKEKYGVYAKNFDLKIGRVLREEDKWVDPDIKNVKKKLERLEENLRESKHDYPAKQAMFQKGAKLRSLKKYRK
ncbi:MAG: hypothetical protein ACOC1P_06895 [Minisyncoccales bacterium]